MSLKDELRGVIPDEKLALMPGRFSIVGDIAIVSIPQDLADHKEDIARAIISRNKYIKTVLNKTSKVQGYGRVARFEILVGDSTITTHREFGHIYKMDVAQVFFNSRLSFERWRIGQKSRPGETVLIPFCGVGPFAVPIAAAGATVVAIEKNSEACRWLAKNSRLNRVEDGILIINGEALNACRMLRRQFDRIVIPAPYGMDHILDVMIPLAKAGGTLHFYTFKKRDQIGGLIEIYESMGLKVEFYRQCGNVAPGVNRWVFDLQK